MTTFHSERLKMLTQRAKSKENNLYTNDLDIGESCYLWGLHYAVASYRSGFIDREKLAYTQKNLESQLLQYYQQCAMFDRHMEINNRYSPVMTEAQKHGCPICKKIVRIFDGRETEN